MQAMFSADPSVIFIAAAVIFGAALVSSIAGFAFSALAGAVVLHLYQDPVRSMAVVVSCSIAIQAYGVWALRRDIHLPRLAAFLLGGVFTVPVGVSILEGMPMGVFSLCLGVVVILYSIYHMRGSHLRVPNFSRRADIAVGAVGGLLGGLIAFPGLVVCIWCGLRGWPKEQQRAIYQPFILLMQLEALACLGAMTPSRVPLEALAFYMPVALFAAYIGFALFRRMSAAQFNLAFHLLLIAAGVSLLGVFPRSL
jgi:uncharacterized membrane protein YfcA